MPHHHDHAGHEHGHAHALPGNNTAFAIGVTLDLAQETFVRVFEHRASYEPRSKFSTWLFTIATNLCRNQARWRERHPTVTLHRSGEDNDPGLEDTTPAPGDTPADSAERHDLASAVRGVGEDGEPEAGVAEQGEDEEDRLQPNLRIFLRFENFLSSSSLKGVFD